MATDIWKDQTLFLCQIKQEAVQRHMFPIGNLMKEHVKKIAREAGLERIAQKKEVHYFNFYIFPSITKNNCSG